MKSLLCSAFVLPALLQAGHYHSGYSTRDTADYYDGNECCSCCCVPQPKKCIDCECYTPKFYDLQCALGAVVSADFLFWFAREPGLYYALQFTGVNIVPNIDPLELVTLQQHLTAAPVEYINFDTKWDPGARVGIGWNFPCDGWDIYLTWTYYHNENTRRKVEDIFSLVPDPGNFGFLNPWVNPAITNTGTGGIIDIQGPMFYNITAHWSLNLNQIDLEMGRKFWLSKCFVLRPYFGLSGAWTNIRFRTHSLNFIRFNNSDVQGIFNFQGSYEDQFKDRFWGVGLLGGIEPAWYFASCFALFGNLDVSLLWGKFRETKKEIYTGFGDISDGEITIFDFQTLFYTANPKNVFFGMQPIIDLALGLRWETSWCCDRFLSTIDAGWEHHIWFNHTHRNKLLGRSTSTTPSPLGMGVDIFDYFTGACEETHDLAFGGFVLRLRFDF